MLRGEFFKTPDETAKITKAIQKRNARIVGYITKRLGSG